MAPALGKPIGNCRPDPYHEHKEVECLKQLQLIVQDQYEQKNPNFENLKEFLDDRFLLHFVRGKNYDVERAYEILERYVNIRRTKQRPFFKSLSARDIGVNNGMLRVLKERDHLGRLVVYDRAGLWDPAKYLMEGTYKLFVLTCEEVWNYEEAETNGIVFIFDLADWTFQQLRALTPKAIANGYNLIGTSMPMKYKEIHLVNENFLVTVVVNLAKAILPKKLGERTHLHSTNVESLHKHISPSILPESLGGSVPDEDAFDDDFEQRIRDKEGYYQRFMEAL